MTQFPGQWVRIMCDDHADAVWDRDGLCCCADDLSVSDALRDELRAWQHAYDNAWEETSRVPSGEWRKDFDLAAFAKWGLVLARRVKAELPDWTVIYHDEAAAQMQGHKAQRCTFEYPV